jgi:ABC-type multidrug transport system permease subunit
VLFVFSAKFFNSGLWGGSMAIRKKDYDDLGVRERWLETGVDDLSLSEILSRRKKKIEFCFDAITDTDDTINDYSKVGVWFVRQVQYLKYHAKPLWFAAILMSVLALSMYALIAIIVLFSTSATAVNYLLVPVFFLGGIYLFAAMFALSGKNRKILQFILMSPISLFNVCLSVIKTAFIGVIDWSGYRYFMSFWDGKVRKVEII